MPALDDSVARVLGLPGARSAALVDVATGTIVASAHDGTAADLTPLAGSAADEIRFAGRGCGQAQPGADVQQIALVTASRLQLTEVLEHGQGGGLLLHADFDLSRTNVGLATRQLGELSAGLLAD